MHFRVWDKKSDRPLWCYAAAGQKRAWNGEEGSKEVRREAAKKLFNTKPYRSSGNTFLSIEICLFYVATAYSSVSNRRAPVY